MASTLLQLLFVASTVSYLAQAQFSGDLRLVDSTSTNAAGAGRLEIYLLGEWGTVCDDGFTITEANVACRQLGYSYAERQGNVGALGYPEASFSSRTWLDDVSCRSTDTTLLSCDHNGIGDENCNHFEDVAVICAGTNVNNGALRLVNFTSTNATAGRLEIFLSGEWGTVCDDGFSTTEANVACRQLGFPTSSRVGNVIRLGYPQASLSTEIWLDDVSCSSSATRLLSCSHSGVGVENCVHTEDVAIVCSTISTDSGDLRLIGSSSSGRGRLEIFLNGEWGTVCDDSFGTTEGDVACRQLGYNSASSVGSVGQLGYSQASSDTEIWLDDVDCSSFDTALLSCSHRGIGVHNCGHSEDVALVCSTSSSGSRALSTGVVTTIVVFAVFGFAVGVPVLFLCLSKKNRGRRRNRRFHSTPAVIAASTATHANPQPAAYPTAAFVSPQAQQAPPPHPSAYQQPEKHLHDSTLQEAPPPPYSQAIAYPPPAYPGQSSAALPSSNPYPTQEAPRYTQPSVQQPASSSAGPSTSAPYPLNPGLSSVQSAQMATPGYPPQNPQTLGYPPQDPGCPQHPPQNPGYPQQAPQHPPQNPGYPQQASQDPGSLAYPPPTAYPSSETGGAPYHPPNTVPTFSGGNAPSAPPL